MPRDVLDNQSDDIRSLLFKMKEIRNPGRVTNVMISLLTNKETRSTETAESFLEAILVYLGEKPIKKLLGMKV